LTRFEVLTAEIVQIQEFWYMTPHLVISSHGILWQFSVFIFRG